MFSGLEAFPSVIPNVSSILFRRNLADWRLLDSQARYNALALERSRIAKQSAPDSTNCFVMMKLLVVFDSRVWMLFKCRAVEPSSIFLLMKSGSEFRLMM